MANLLDRASVVLTPTAYNNGEALCIKPDDGSGDFQFSRNSAATRVNAQGLVENVQILSSNLVQNGNFSEEGSEEVSNGSFSQEGVQLVTNGSFDTDSDWAKGTGWSISGGSANCDGTQTSGTNLIQNGLALGTNKIFKIEFELKDYQAGELIYVNLTGTGILEFENINANGTYVAYSGLSTGDNFITFRADADFIGSIDNVSVREVAQDWTLGSGWSIGEDKAVHTGAQSLIGQTNILTIGKSYKITFDLSGADNSNYARLLSSQYPNGGNYTSDGTITVYTTTNIDDLYIYGVGNISITNISVKEVGQNWDLGNWSVGDSLVSSGNTSFLSQTNVYTSTTSIYKTTFKARSVNGTSVTLRLYDGANAFETFTITSSTFEDFTLTRQRQGINTGLYFYNNSDAEIEITNISVIEITDDTNLPRINYEGFSYDGSGNVVPDSGCGSWLFEPQSTNLVLTSDSGTYGSTPPSETNTISPDGTNNAIIPTPTANANRYQEGLAGGVYSSGQKITYSWYRKRISTPVIDTEVGDLIIQVLTNLTIFESTTQIQSNINGYDRFQVVVQLTDGSLPSTFRAYFGSIIGVGNSSVAYWGHQFEVGGYATSLIPTEGSSVTRNQDVCNNGGSLASINSTSGVLYAEIAALSATGNNSNITLTDGSGNNRIYIYYLIDNSISVIYNINSTGASLNNFSLSNITDQNKIAVRWGNSNVSVWINGTSVLSNTTSNFLPNTLNVLNFSKPSGSDNFFGKTKAVAVWKEALSDEELTELTTI